MEALKVDHDRHFFPIVAPFRIETMCFEIILSERVQGNAPASDGSVDSPSDTDEEDDSGDEEGGDGGGGAYQDGGGEEEEAGGEGKAKCVGGGQDVHTRGSKGRALDLIEWMSMQHKQQG
jgi:hypothetical protein